MSSDARSDAVKHLAASIRRYAIVAAIKRQALAAASLACDRPDEPCRSLLIHTQQPRADQQATTASATAVRHC